MSEMAVSIGLIFVATVVGCRAYLMYIFSDEKPLRREFYFLLAAAIITAFPGFALFSFALKP